MKIQIWEQNANFAISDSDSHFFHKCIKIAVGRIEQEICAYECTSHNADIRWVKVIAEMFGLDFDFVNRAGDCERSFPSAIMIIWCSSGKGVWMMAGLRVDKPWIQSR